MKSRHRVAIGAGVVALSGVGLLLARDAAPARHGSDAASLVSGARAATATSHLGDAPKVSPRALAASGSPAAQHPASPTALLGAGEDIDWGHWYSASGHVTESPDGGSERDYSVAPYFDARWDDTRGGFLVQATDKDGYTTGTEFICTDTTCARFTNVYVTLPLEQDGHHGSVTLGFPMSTSLPWRSLGNGERATAVDKENRYLVTIRRSEGPTWIIEVRPNPGGPGPTQYFDHGSLTLTTDSDSVPWTSMTYSLNASAIGGSVEGTWALHMLPGSSPPAVR